MTFYEVLKAGEEMLRQGNTENSAFDARCIFNFAFGMDEKDYIINSKMNCNDTKDFFPLIEKRLAGCPLQYIIGEWDFMSCTFKVGEGVLIPRQDTELLAEKAMEYMGSHSVKTVFDLCSGSGCIGISLAKEFPKTDFYCVEISDDALKYLNENVSLNGVDNITVIKGDIKKGFDNFRLPRPDVILSNPPYISSSETLSLQKEVLSEPQLALDGGDDGLDFYRVIYSKWTDCLKEKGALFLECGEDQAEKIRDIFGDGFSCEIFRDYNNIQRLTAFYKSR